MKKRNYIYFGTFEKKYPRNRLIIDLIKDDLNLKIIHRPLWEKHNNKSKFLKNPFLLFLFLFDTIKTYLFLIFKIFQINNKNTTLITGYIGQFDLTLLWIFHKILRFNIVANPLVSFYDTIVEDRKLVSGIFAKLILWWEKKIYSICSQIWVDTEQNREFFIKKFNLLKEKVFTVYVSAEENYFFPIKDVTKFNKFTILFYGKYIPLHGLEKIIETIPLLKDLDINWKFVGKGQLFNLISKQLIALKDEKFDIDIIEWIEYEKLNETINKSHIVLGIFGETSKSKRVIPNKVFQSVATGALVLTQKSRAILEIFNEQEIITCHNSPQEIAKTVETIYKNYDKYKIYATNGYNAYIKKTSNQTIKNRVLTLLKRD